jgi:iron complex outermembrane receptor protein
MPGALGVPMVRLSLMNSASALALTVAFTLIPASQARAQSAPKPQSGSVESLPDVNVAAQRRSGAAVPDNVPAVIEGVSAKQILTEVNAMTTGETLKYIPSVEVRQRSIGDRNGIVATRTTGTISSAQSTVYADTLLLSNFLGNTFSYPPRWGMVSTQEIERIDVIYGPFSALYSGNSMGGVVTVTTRMPKQFEFYATLRGATSSFNQYGTSQNNPSFNGNVAVGNRINDLSFWLSYDRLDSKGQPLNFANITTDKTATLSPASNFNGGYYDTDNFGKPRFVYGANSIDHSVQDMGKLKIAYDFTPGLKATYVAGLWGLNSDVTVRNYLKDAAGNTIYPSSSIIAPLNGRNYALSANNPSKANALHLMQGLSLKSDTKRAFDFEAALSSYDFLTDTSRAPTTYNGTNTTAGRITQQSGSGWSTADLRGIWRPQADLLGRHEVTFGSHYDLYRLKQYAYAASAWADGPEGAYNSASLGRTETKAFYIQDVWSLTSRLKLTLGERIEWWRAFDGINQTGAALVGFAYPERSATASSPKASLSYQATEDMLVRFSAGKATRFPTVNELFQSTALANGTVQNDPNLKPEEVNSYDLTGEYSFGKNILRLSGFREDRLDGIFQYTPSGSTTSLYRNVDKMRVYGIETAIDAQDVLVEGLSFRGSVTWATSEILANSTNPAYVGGRLPRIPAWRAKLVGSYSPSDKWSMSVGIRYSSPSFGQLDNTDWNHNVFGGISSYLVADVRFNYNIDKNWSLAAGIDNIGNYKYYVNPHPYPGRTFLTELRYKY